MISGAVGYVVGNPQASVLAHDVTLRAAPSEELSGESITTGTRIDQPTRREVNGKLWVEVTISDIWVGFQLTPDPDSLPPEGEVEYIYTPE